MNGEMAGYIYTTTLMIYIPLEREQLHAMVSDLEVLLIYAAGYQNDRIHLTVQIEISVVF